MITLFVLVAIVGAFFALLNLPAEKFWSLRLPFICCSWLPTGIGAGFIMWTEFVEATEGYGMLAGLAVSVVTSFFGVLLGGRFLSIAAHEHAPRTLLRLATAVAAFPMAAAVFSLLLKAIKV